MESALPEDAVPRQLPSDRVCGCGVVQEIQGARLVKAARRFALVLLSVLATTPLAASAESLVERLSQAREVRVERLATRLEWPTRWNPDSVSNWTRRTALGGARLTKGQRMLLAHALTDSVVPRPPLWHRSGLFDAEDCDFLLLVKGAMGPNAVLLSFPESQARWLGSDSVVSVVRFEGHALRAIQVLRSCFPHDSTVQDLPAAVGWFLHNPTMTAEGDGVIPWYEGLPRIISEVPCESPRTDHPPPGSVAVWVEALIDHNGAVRLTRPARMGGSPTIPALEESAMDCVRRRRFTPASFGGHAFGFRSTIPVTYKFE